MSWWQDFHELAWLYAGPAVIAHTNCFLAAELKMSIGRQQEPALFQVYH